MEAPATITCVDCGGTCHLLSYPQPDEHAPDGSAPNELASGGFAPGDIVAYRCEDCLDRWDIELE